MKPRIKAFSLAFLASLGLMGGCKKDNKKIDNPKVEITTIEATIEPTMTVTPSSTPTSTVAPTDTPSPTPTMVPTDTPSPIPTMVPVEGTHITLFDEIDASKLKRNENLIIDPYVQWFLWSEQNVSNVTLEAGWTKSNIRIPTFKGYGYCGFALDYDGNYIWILTNLCTVTKKYDVENDVFTQDIWLDEDSKTYETTNKIVSISPGKIIDESNEYSEFKEKYGDGFYEPLSHLIYYVLDDNELFDNKGNLTIEIPEGYDVIVASQVPNTNKAIIIFTNCEPVLVDEDVKLPGKVLEIEKQLVLHL